MTAYAVQLKGEEPMGVQFVAEFDSESTRDEWVSHGEEDGDVRVVVAESFPSITCPTYQHFHITWKSNRRWMDNLTNFAGGWKYEQI